MDGRYLRAPPSARPLLLDERLLPRAAVVIASDDDDGDGDGDDDDDDDPAAEDRYTNRDSETGEGVFHEGVVCCLAILSSGVL